MNDTDVAASTRLMRDATMVDLPRLSELFERFRLESPYAQCGPAAPEMSTGLMQQLITFTDGLLLVLELGEQIVGMIGVLVSVHPMSGERVATELFWYVEPDQRGHGIGLLKRAEQWAVAREAKFILMVSLENQPAVHRIYEALGYLPGETSWYKSLDWFDRHQPKVGASQPLPHGIVVHDGVLSDPDAYRAKALAQRFQAVQDGPVIFQRMAPCADPTVPLWIVLHYPQLMPTLTFFRQGELNQPEPHYIHTDASMGDWTAILFLNPEPPYNDGTVFWKHTPSGDIGSREISAEEGAKWFTENAWIDWHFVSAVFNRLVLFPSWLYHSRSIRENYGHGDTARLTQNTFGTGEFP